MIVPENVRKCVVFLGYKMANGEIKLAGSAFFLGRGNDGPKAENVVLVTVRHVVDGIRKRGLDQVHVRSNTKSGDSVWNATRLDDWKFNANDKSVDVAYIPLGVDEDYDHLVIPYSLCATDKRLKDDSVGLGDEVFVTGLFRHHHGTKRNIPIVRVGNLAAMSEEKVSTKAFGLIDAYLIEARSIGGISGSPVFLNLGITRFIDKKIQHSNGPMFYLLGLIHGHYDVESAKIDAVDSGDNASSAEHVNSGIAVVVPMHKIFETIGEPV